MIQYIFYILFLFTTSVFAQNSILEEIEKKETLNGNTYQIELGFNSIKKIIKKQDAFYLEIQPIADCITGLEGRTMFELILVDIKNTNNFTINYNLVKRKCCKYRLKMVKNKQITFTDWIFYALVK